MSFESIEDVWRYQNDVQTRINSGEIWIGRRHYALSLLYGVLQAIHCGYERITAIELGVAQGDGLLDLCRAARYFSETTHVAIDVIGLDNGTGLPPTADYRDHPEVWRQGQFDMGGHERLKSRLPVFADLLIGDVSETLGELRRRLNGPIAFVAVDLDYYSSTRNALGIFNFDAESYVPAVPVYFDDVEGFISNSDWTGEGLAIREFNEASATRKIGPKDFGIRNLYVCHTFDHPVRSGAQKPVFPLEIYSGFVPESTELQRKFLVRHWQKHGMKVAVAPAGNHAFWLFENSPGIDDVVSCFIDNKASSGQSSFLGKPLIAPSGIPGFDFDVLIVASPNNEEAIVEQLKGVGMGENVEIVSTRRIAHLAKSLGWR